MSPLLTFRRSRLLAVLATMLTPLALVVPPAGAQGSPRPESAEKLIAGLTPEQRLALDQLEGGVDVRGLRVQDAKALSSDEPVDVIVQLAQPPAPVARLLAAAKGQSMSEPQAKGLAETASSHPPRRCAPGTCWDHNENQRRLSQAESHVAVQSRSLVLGARSWAGA